MSVIELSTFRTSNYLYYHDAQHEDVCKDCADDVYPDEPLRGIRISIDWGEGTFCSRCGATINPAYCVVCNKPIADDDETDYQDETDDQYGGLAHCACVKYAEVA